MDRLLNACPLWLSLLIGWIVPALAVWIASLAPLWAAYQLQQASEMQIASHTAHATTPPPMPATAHPPQLPESRLQELHAISGFTLTHWTWKNATQITLIGQGSERALWDVLHLLQQETTAWQIHLDGTPDTSTRSARRPAKRSPLPPATTLTLEITLDPHPRYAPAPVTRAAWAQIRPLFTSGRPCRHWGIWGWLGGPATPPCVLVLEAGRLVCLPEGTPWEGQLLAHIGPDGVRNATWECHFESD